MAQTCDTTDFVFIILTLNQDLETGVKKALSGELATVLLDLLMPPLEYEAHRLQQAMVVSGRLCVAVCSTVQCVFA